MICKLRQGIERKLMLFVHVCQGIVCVQVQQPVAAYGLMQSPKLTI